MGIATPRGVQNELSTSRFPKRPPWLAVLFGVYWVALVAGGIGSMHRYDNTPGLAGHASAVWPVASRIPRTPGQATPAGGASRARTAPLSKTSPR